MNIIARRKPISWTGHEIQPGEIGLINHGGIPEILTEAGRYPGFPLRCVTILERALVSLNIMYTGCGGRGLSREKRDSRIP